MKEEDKQESDINCLPMPKSTFSALRHNPFLRGKDKERTNSTGVDSYEGRQDPPPNFMERHRTLVHQQPLQVPNTVRGGLTASEVERLIMEAQNMPMQDSNHNSSRIFIRDNRRMDTLATQANNASPGHFFENKGSILKKLSSRNSSLSKSRQEPLRKNSSILPPESSMGSCSRIKLFNDLMKDI